MVLAAVTMMNTVFCHVTLHGLVKVLPNILEKRTASVFMFEE
jgi:hypothetical protein